MLRFQLKVSVVCCWVRRCPHPKLEVWEGFQILLQRSFHPPVVGLQDCKSVLQGLKSGLKKLHGAIEVWYACQVTFTNHLQPCRVYFWLFDDDAPLNAPISTCTQQCISTGRTMVKELLLRSSAVITPEHVSFNSVLDYGGVVHPSLLQQWYNFSYPHCNTLA